jgi:hypothetical protein
VAEHDNGWWESDAAPRFDPRSRRPVDFRAVPPEERREIWRRGVERDAGDDPYRAALIAGHALRLLGPRYGAEPAWSDWLAELGARRDELAERSGLSAAELRADDRWLELADELALVAASGEALFCRRDDLAVEVESRPEETRLALAPFPLAGATRFELACRTLPLEPRGTDSELARALATARWQRRSIRLVEAL